MKEETERLAADKKKKKPIRYPTEDLDVRLAEKEKKAGIKVMKPVPSRILLPFGEDQSTFESFLMAWNFLVVYGYASISDFLCAKLTHGGSQPLHLSSFTMDEFEHALRHAVIDTPCMMLAEIHSTLIYNLRTVPFTRHSAVLSLLRLKDTLEEDHELFGVTIDDLTMAMTEVGNNWERVPLRHVDMREGWEDALVGCLKDVSLWLFRLVRFSLPRSTLQ